MKKKSKNTKVEIAILLIFFALCFAINFVCSIQSKSLHILLDEIRFYEIAKNIFYNRGLNILHVDLQFQKILWPVFLSPFFAIQNEVVRINCITLFSSFLFASACIPLWLISDKFKLNLLQKILLAIIFITLPSASYTIGFMSEPLYFPLILWTIYVWVVNNKAQSKILSVLSGFMCYLVYLCKETGICFLFSYILLELLMPIAKWCFAKNANRKKIKNYINLNRFVNLGLYTLTFGLLFLTLKFTIFRGFGNSYNIDFSCFTDISKFSYLIYANVYYLIAFVACLFILPFILPILFYKNMDNERRQFYWYLIFLVLTFGFITVFGCVMSETLYDIVPRLDFRYFFPFFPLFFIVSYNSIAVSIKKKIDVKRLIIISIITCAFILFIYKGPGHWSTLWIDACELAWHQLFYGFVSENDYISIFGFVSLINLLVIFVGALSMWFLCHKKFKISSIMMTLSFSVMCLTSRIYLIQKVSGYYYRDPFQMKEIIDIDCFMQKNKGAKFMYITTTHGGSHIPTICLYTYIDSSDRLYCINENDLQNKVFSKYENVAKISEISFQDFLLLEKGYTYQTDRFDYYIFDNQEQEYEKKITNTEKIDSFQGKYFSIYKNVSPEYICFN